ncbi:MAG: hypothetical protein MJZ85_11230 [Bacteroidales bacterium]|nr:hypothetical protein [Bacteroidales bacterium]
MKMHITEKKFLEINISGENAKEDALGKITGFIEQNPSSEKLIGCLYAQTGDENGSCLELIFDMERPDTQSVREAFAKLPVCARFEGTLFIHIRSWIE